MRQAIAAAAAFDIHPPRLSEHKNGRKKKSYLFCFLGQKKEKIVISSLRNSFLDPTILWDAIRLDVSKLIAFL